MSFEHFKIALRVFISIAFCLTTNLQANSTSEESPELIQTLVSNKVLAVDNFQLAKIEFERRNYEKSQALIQKSIAQGRDSADEYVLYGKIKGRLASDASIFSAASLASDSEKYLLKALELDNQHIAAMQGLIQFYTRAPFIAGGSIKKAESMASRLSAQNNLLGNLSKLEIYRHEGDKKQSMITSRLLLDGYPNSAQVLYQVGLTYQFFKLYDDAQKLFMQSSFINTPAEVLHAVSSLYQVGRNALKASKFYSQGVSALIQYLSREFVEGTPPKDWARLRLSGLYLKMGLINEAKGELGILSKKNVQDKKLAREIKKLYKRMR